ncbi:MAG: NAD(P)H-quinone oxidoreductase [Alphaproteobacteria bacterium]|nr:NAD(P)H-quinone oxidoreductase [Alphaproteobacteria bacterium]
MTLPKQIDCIEIIKYGGPENLVMTKRDTPQIKKNELLIKVEAAGVNRPDIMQRQGLYPPPPGASDIPGLEVAGEVVAINTNKSRFKIGDKVCALVSGGGYSSYCIAPIEQTLPIPKGLSYIEAAAIPETFFTVWANVFDRGKLTKNDTILIHGGASGIGTTAIQLASSFGAKVFTTVGSEEKCNKMKELGAELAINYNRDDFEKIINEYTNNKGINIILDIIGASYFNKNLNILSKNGKLLIIAFQGGYENKLNLLPILKKWLTVTGSTLRPRSVEEKGLIANQLYEKVWPLIEKKVVLPQIYGSYKLKDANKAHTLVESSQHIGKIVLTI